MSAGERLALAAGGLVGVRFRLHGRDPGTGLDCVGLIAASLAACGRIAAVPSGYGLRNAAITGWIGCAARSGLVPATGGVRPGDVVLTCPGPGQHHLMIAADAASVIHAHAGLGRVVRQSLPARFAPCARWRLPDPDFDRS